MMNYDIIMGRIQAKHGGLFFVYGYRGIAKTFNRRTFATALRSKGEIIL